jgi:hypothetical protein
MVAGRDGLRRPGRTRSSGDPLQAVTRRALADLLVDRGRDMSPHAILLAARASVYPISMSSNAESSSIITLSVSHVCSERPR